MLYFVMQRRDNRRPDMTNQNDGKSRKWKKTRFISTLELMVVTVDMVSIVGVLCHPCRKVHNLLQCVLVHPVSSFANHPHVDLLVRPSSTPTFVSASPSFCLFRFNLFVRFVPFCCRLSSSPIFLTELRFDAMREREGGCTQSLRLTRVMRFDLPLVTTQTYGFILAAKQRDLFGVAGCAYYQSLL